MSVPAIRHDDLLLRLVRDVNEIRSILRRTVANLPLFDVANENTPATITANQNDYVPGNYDILRLSSSLDVSITGIANGKKGRFIKVFNVGSYAITFEHQSTSSATENRLKFSIGTGQVLLPGSSIVFYYDSTQLRWIEGNALEDTGVAKEATMPQITSNQNNYDPSDYGVIRLSSDADRTITGFQGGVKGRFLHLYNVGNFIITLANESLSSDAANRILSPSGIDIDINRGGGVVLYYDSTLLRWISSPYNQNANRLRKTALSRGSQVIATTTEEYLEFDTVISDDGDWFDALSPTKITVEIDGIYAPYAYVEFDDTGGDGSIWWIRTDFRVNGGGRENGTMYAHEKSAFSKFVTIGGTPIEMNAGDYIECVVEHNYGSDRTLAKANFTLLQLG